MYVLLRLELNHLSTEAQQDILKPLNIIPFKYRLFYRFSLFSHKILNTFFLLNISNFLKPVEKTVNTRSNRTNLFITPLVLSHRGSKRISIVLTIMINKVLRNSTNLNIKDYITYINSNISDLFQKFSKFVLRENFNFL